MDGIYALQSQGRIGGKPQPELHTAIMKNTKEENELLFNSYIVK